MLIARSREQREKLAVESYSIEPSYTGAENRNMSDFQSFCQVAAYTIFSTLRQTVWSCKADLPLLGALGLQSRIVEFFVERPSQPVLARRWYVAPVFGCHCFRPSNVFMLNTSICVMSVLMSRGCQRGKLLAVKAGAAVDAASFGWIPRRFSCESIARE